MPMLTIAGTNYDVASATERKPEVVGDTGRSFAGTLRSDVSVEKRVIEVALKEITEAALSTLRAAVALSAQVTVSGDIPGSSLTMVVELSEAGYRHDGTSMHRGVRLLMTEV